MGIMWAGMEGYLPSFSVKDLCLFVLFWDKALLYSHALSRTRNPPPGSASKVRGASVSHCVSFCPVFHAAFVNRLSGD